MKKLLCLLLTIWVCCCHAQTKITNPILAGFYPDPSVCFDGKCYYLINSTFAYFPGIPIFKSADLVNWRQIGSVISKPAQMDFKGEQLSRGLFAPSISFHDGMYYVVCTDIDHLGTFIVTAKNPAGSWSNPVPIPNVKGIDPSLFFDKGKTYLIYNSDAPDNKPMYTGHRTIRICEFDINKLKTIGDEHILVNGGTDISKKPIWIEGPHIYKRNEFYYLLAAEGGTSVNHSEVVFRSNSATGSYTPYEKNPILTQRNLDPARPNPITSTGHADLIEGPDGKTYAVFLGVRPYKGDYYNTGRETFMAPVTWQNNWPVINQAHKEVQYSYKVSLKQDKGISRLYPLHGNFEDKTDFKRGIPQSMLFLRTLDSSWFKITRQGLTLKLKPETIMEYGNPAFIGRRQQHLRCSASVKMMFNANIANEKAGLIIFADELHFYYLCKSINNVNIRVIQLYKGNPQEKTMDLVKETAIGDYKSEILLRINAVDDKYSFEYALGKAKWQSIGNNLDGRYLSTKVAGGFVGSLFGIYATSAGKVSTNMANFEWLDYVGNDAIYKK